jgi:hypothetical protein
VLQTQFPNFCSPVILLWLLNFGCPGNLVKQLPTDLYHVLGQFVNGRVNSHMEDELSVECCGASNSKNMVFVASHKQQTTRTSVSDQSKK